MANLLSVDKKQPQVQIDNTLITDFQNLIVLRGQASSATNKYTTLKREGAAAGYQVTAGKRLYIVAIIYLNFAAGSNTPYLGAGTSDVGDASAAAPTGYTANTCPGIINVAANSVTPKSYCLSIEGSKYVCANLGDAGNIIVYGYEA